jgi:uncharacterized protein HemX
MDKELNSLELTHKKDCKKKHISDKMASNLISIIVAIISASGVGYGFYYNTNSRLNYAEQEINEIQTDVNNIKTILSETQTYQSVNTAELKHINEDLDKIEENQKELIKLIKEKLWK